MEHGGASPLNCALPCKVIPLISESGRHRVSWDHSVIRPQHAIACDTGGCCLLCTYCKMSSSGLDSALLKSTALFVRARAGLSVLRDVSCSSVQNCQPPCEMCVPGAQS